MSYVAKTEEEKLIAVVMTNGDEIRPGETKEWSDYLQWLDQGNITQDRFTQEQWNLLNKNSQERLISLAPIFDSNGDDHG